MINETVWKMVQEHLGYSDEEMKLFRENPRNEEVLEKAPGMVNKTIILEVVKSHGCNSKHKVGEKFYYDGVGNLLTKLAPSRICIHALAAGVGLINAAHELYYAGLDPNTMRFKRTSCADVGVECGGWGQICLEIKVEERKK